MSQLDETSAMDRVDIFLEALRHDDDPSVRYVAARALKRRGWQPGNLNDTILSAIGLTKRDELVRIGTPAVQPMIKAYTNTDSSRYALSWIPYAIAEIGDPQAIPFLTRTVLSGFPQERWPRDPSELTHTASSNPRLRDDVQASFNALINLGHPAQEYLANLLADTNRAKAWRVADSRCDMPWPRKDSPSKMMRSQFRADESSPCRGIYGPRCASDGPVCER